MLASQVHETQDAQPQGSKVKVKLDTYMDVDCGQI